MFGYIYMTTNLRNGKKYIGKKHSSEFDEKYIGSGSLLWKDIEQNNYKRQDFIVEILDSTATNLKELNELEKFYIKKYNAVKSDLFYNVASGGDGGKIYKVHPKGFMGHKHSEETKRIQAETINKYVNKTGLNTNWKNGHPKGMLGKKHSKESNDKRAISNRNSYKNYFKTKVIFPNGNVVYFNSREEACIKLKISEHLFDKIVKSKQPYVVTKNTTHNLKHLKTLEGMQIIKIENTEVSN